MIKVDVDSKFPLFIRADPDAFGQVFAAMSDGDQVQVMRSIMMAMKKHPTQWDFISIELEKPENADVLSAWLQPLLEAKGGAA
jgi:hypothetical protein